jgi:hypothetical protein
VPEATHNMLTQSGESATLSDVAQVTEAEMGPTHELIETLPTLAQSVELSQWTFDAALLAGDGTSIDEILAKGGTFYGREALDAWRFLPPNGWRQIHEDATSRVYAAPEPGAVGEWAVASVRLEGGVWRAAGAERNLFPHATGTAPATDLELVWPSEQIIVRGRQAQLFAKVKNHGTEPWLADYKEPLTVVAWLIDLPSNRRLLASRADFKTPLNRVLSRSILVPPAAAIVVPVALATIAPETLVPGTYGIVGRLERLNLTSETGTVVIVER